MIEAFPGRGSGALARGTVRCWGHRPAAAVAVSLQKWSVLSQTFGSSGSMASKLHWGSVGRPPSRLVAVLLLAHKFKLDPALEVPLCVQK